MKTTKAEWQSLEPGEKKSALEYAAFLTKKKWLQINLGERR